MRIASLAIVFCDRPDWIVERLKQTQTLCALFCGDMAVHTAQQVSDLMPDLLPYIATKPGEAYERVLDAVRFTQRYHMEADTIIVLCPAARALEIALLIRHFQKIQQVWCKSEISIEASGWEPGGLPEDAWATFATWRRIRRAERS